MTRRRFWYILLIAIMLLSIVVLCPIMSSIGTYRSCIRSIDKSKDEVMVISASSSAASALMTVLPDDWATPIAEELADLTKTFLVVLAVLYAEKYLLTIIGFIATAILIPVSCILGICYVWTPEWKRLRQIAVKIFILAIVSVLIVPTSIWISNSIESTFHESIESIEQKALENEKLLAENNGSNEESKNFFQKIGDTISKAWKDVTEGAKNLLNQAKDLLSYYIELIAIRIVIDCIIPLLVLFGYAMLIKYVFNLPYTVRDVSNRVLPQRKRKEANQERFNQDE